MAIKTIRVRTIEGAIRELERLAIPDQDFVFRGHREESWRLESTLARHIRRGTTELAIVTMDEMIDHFFNCLASIGKLPERDMSLRTLLEFARHHGVPSPLIDFSRSPYVALWMAFDGVRANDGGNVVIYALNVNGLGILWQKYRGTGEAFGEFRFNENKENKGPFADGYPLHVLKALDFPTSWNTRMLRQQGMFVYDSLQYGQKHEFKDLEELIAKGIDPTGPDGEPTFALHKIHIPKSIVSEIFERLELMGIDGTRLLDNHEGAVADVKNAYVFNRRGGFTHDTPWREKSSKLEE